MKKLLSLLLVCALLCGCAQNNIPADTTITTAVEDSKADEVYDLKSYDFSAYSEKIEYNSDPDASSKPLPGAYDLADGFVPYSTTDLMKEAYGVVVVNITKKIDPIIIETTKRVVDKETGKKVEVPEILEVPAYEAEVIKSLGGGHNEGDIVKISTYAERYGIKFAEGKDYLIITTDIHFSETDEYYYPPNCMIHSVFNINEDYTVTAQSSLSVSAKYDGLALADVAHDFEEAFKRANSQ